MLILVWGLKLILYGMSHLLQVQAIIFGKKKKILYEDNFTVPQHQTHGERWASQQKGRTSSSVYQAS